MSRLKVFVSRRLPDEGLNAITAACDVDLWPEQLPAAIRRAARAGEGLRRACVAAHRPDRWPASGCCSAAQGGQQLRGRLQQHRCAGLHARGVCVGNTPGVLTDATADMAVCCCSAAARRLVESAADAKAGRWKTWEPLGWLGQDLAGRTLGIVGMGRIGYAAGQAIASRLGHEGALHGAGAAAEADKELGARRVELDKLLAQSDFVSAHVDLNAHDEGDVQGCRSSRR